MNTEIIVAVAFKVGDMILSMPKPARHGDLFSQINYARLELVIKPSDQGFITSEGCFVDRKTAKVIAAAAEQLLPRHSPNDELYSEDLW